MHFVPVRHLLFSCVCFHRTNRLFYPMSDDNRCILKYLAEIQSYLYKRGQESNKTYSTICCPQRLDNSPVLSRDDNTPLPSSSLWLVERKDFSYLIHTNFSCQSHGIKRNET